MVRIVGKVRWLYLIDVLHHKYKVKNRQDGRRIWSQALKTWPWNTNRCPSNIIFALLIIIKKQRFIKLYSKIRLFRVYLMRKRFIKCACDGFSKEHTLPKRKEIRTQRRIFKTKKENKKRSNIPPSPSCSYCSRSQANEKLIN